MVLSVISVLGTKNPFLPQIGPDMVTLHTREIMPSAFVEVLCNAYERGNYLHENCVSERLRTGEKNRNKANALKQIYLIAVHSFPVATVPVRFLLGQLLQF